MKDSVIVIGSWGNGDLDSIRLQDFIIDGEKVIPIFSDESAFDRQTNGSGFEQKGLIIKVHFLLSFLRGYEVFLLNPGDAEPVRLTTADLADAFANGRELMAQSGVRRAPHAAPL